MNVKKNLFRKIADAARFLGGFVLAMFGATVFFGAAGADVPGWTLFLAGAGGLLIYAGVKAYLGTETWRKLDSGIDRLLEAAIKEKRNTR